MSSSVGTQSKALAGVAPMVEMRSAPAMKRSGDLMFRDVGAIDFLNLQYSDRD